MVPGHFGALAGTSMAYEVAGKYEDSAEALRSTLNSHPWATRGPTVLAALLKKIDSQRNESVVEEVLAGLDGARKTGGRSEKVKVPAPGVVRSTRKRGQKRDNSSSRGSSGASTRKENGEGEK